MLVFRVRVTGGPANGSVVSQTFTIDVTPVPLAQLAPEAPGNTSLQTSGSESKETAGNSEKHEAAEAGGEGVIGKESANEGNSGGEGPSGGGDSHGGPHHGHRGH
jgi:hypothetical protein